MENNFSPLYPLLSYLLCRGYYSVACVGFRRIVTLKTTAENIIGIISNSQFSNVRLVLSDFCKISSTKVNAPPTDCALIQDNVPNWIRQFSLKSALMERVYRAKRRKTRLRDTRAVCFESGVRPNFETP